MAGRRAPEHGGGRTGRRPQAPKRESGRPERPRTPGAPRPIGTGKGRSFEATREGGWLRRGEDDLADLAAGQRHSVSGKRLEEISTARGFGAPLEGTALPGTVIEVHRGECLVALDAPPALSPGAAPLPAYLRTAPRGMLQQFDLGLSSLVAAGDRVAVNLPEVQGDEEYVAVLARVEPRQGEFRRLHPSGRAIQTLAANVAQVAIVASASEPDFRPGFVDRVLACAASSALPAILVLNKLDLGLRAEDAVLLDVYAGLGISVLRTSVLDGRGLPELRAALAGRRTVLCGHSGVGKSSLLTALHPELAPQIRVQQVSGRTTKGQHTTTHARLYRLDGTEVIDTPGVREFTPADTDRQNLWAWFPEIAARRAACAFGSCTHTVEKGCAILKDVAEGRMHPRRHESYLRIYRTLTG